MSTAGKGSQKTGVRHAYAGYFNRVSAIPKNDTAPHAKREIDHPAVDGAAIDRLRNVTVSDGAKLRTDKNSCRSTCAVTSVDRDDAECRRVTCEIQGGGRRVGLV